MPSSTERSERKRLEAHLRSLSIEDLHELAIRHSIAVPLGATRKAIRSALLASPASRDVLEELDRGHAQSLEASFADRLARIRDSIREAANIGALVGPAEEAWRSAGDLTDRGRRRDAEDQLARAALLLSEARARRMRELEETLATIEDHILLARAVGADVGEASRLLEEAGGALKSQAYTEATDLLKRAERVAMEGQQKKIDQAILLQQLQVAKAMAIVASSEPIIQEAESYDIDVAEARTLLRQARDVLGKGDILAGLPMARNAEESAYRLETKVDAERKRRGIERPRPGVCGACGSDRLKFFDDGWGTCESCQVEFRWRGPLGIRERVRELLGT
jgi:hypothetical protein